MVQVAKESTPLKPVYFRFLTLLAFHSFLRERVSATILEVGVGGAYDSTNIVPRPISTGVTSLGLDHVPLLGTTLGEVAWNKAGIYKPGVPALSVEQPEDAMEVLRKRAKELEVRLLSGLSPEDKRLTCVSLYRPLRSTSSPPGRNSLLSSSVSQAFTSCPTPASPSRFYRRLSLLTPFDPFRLRSLTSTRRQ